MDLGLIDAAASAALIGTRLLSVLLFPLTGLVPLRRSAPGPRIEATADAEPTASLMAM